MRIALYSALIILAIIMVVFHYLCEPPPRFNPDGTPFHRTLRQEAFDEWFYDYRHLILTGVWFLGGLTGAVLTLLIYSYQ